MMRKLTKAEKKLLNAMEDGRKQFGLPILFPDQRPKYIQDATINNLYKLGLVKPTLIASFCPLILTDAGEQVLKESRGE